MSIAQCTLQGHLIKRQPENRPPPDDHYKMVITKSSVKGQRERQTKMR